MSEDGELNSKNPFLIQEILEIIMFQMDGVSLARSERVSKVWKDAAQRLAKCSNIWKRCCEKEIDKYIRMDLVNENQPSWSESQSNINWKEIYRNWFLWKKITNWPYLTSCIVQENLSVTCARISGNCVVTGHKNGDLRAWTYEESWEIGHHERFVTDIGVMIEADSAIRNKCRHEYVVSTSHDHTVQVNLLISNQKGFPIIIKEHRTPTLLIRTYGNYFAVLSEDQRITVWQLMYEARRDPGLLRCCTIRYNIHTIADINIYGTQVIKVTAVTNEGLFIPVYSKKGPLNYDLVLQDMAHRPISELWELDGRILQVFFWRCDTTIILTDERYMYVRIIGHKQVKYNTMRYLYAHPVIVKLYGQILLLGMSSGMMFMYFLNDTTDLLKLQFDKYYWRCAALTDPIISLDVTETESGPKIVAATRSKVVSILFLPRWLRR